MRRSERWRDRSKLVFQAGRPPLLLLTLWLLSLWTAGAAPPATPRRPVVDTYHGVAVEEDYRWLEAGEAPEVRRWSEGQNAEARRHLDGLPSRRLIREQLTRLLSEGTTNYSSVVWRAGRLFLIKFAPPAQQPILVTLESATNAASERVVLDPGLIDPRGATTIDWYVPSPDGKRVAVSLSENGTELGTLQVFEAETGKPLPDRIPGVHGPTAGGSAVWSRDGTGIFYTRYPREGERPKGDRLFYQQVWFHRLGTPPASDLYEIGKEFPRIAEVVLESSPDGQRVLARVANGDGGEFAFHLREPDGTWREVAGFSDRITQAEFGRDPLYIESGRDNALYLLSLLEAPRGRLLRLPFSAGSLGEATVILPEGTNVLATFRPSASGLALVYRDGGPSHLRFLPFGEKTPLSPQEAPLTGIQELVVTHGDEILYQVASYTQPVAWRRYDPTLDRERVDSTQLTSPSSVDFSDIEGVREKVLSKDGTRVPLTILRRKGTRLDGRNPVLLQGYGGYGISLSPRFDVTRRVWFDRGGILAIANLRGGGEYGEQWHTGGNLLRKQNVFDDFAACASFLIESNYTSPGRLAIEGGSNGGLLMGATLTQHPGLFRAVVSHVGLYDMLRVELDPNGEFNITEFGSVRDPEQFRALHAYSPYHQVRDGTRYPAVLMLTGEMDGRVNPAHSRKMVARLQAATAKGGGPILLRTSAHSGHGIGTPLNERQEQQADVYAFLFDTLGLEYSLVDRGPWSGGVTPRSATVKARLARPDLRARLLLSQDPGLNRPWRSPVEVSDADRFNVVEFPVGLLHPDTRYHYALEIDGRIDPGSRGELRTFPPPGPASFSVAFGSCARTGSTSDVFDRIREADPLFFLHMGDFHYLDIRTNSRARFRAAYESVLASPQQSDLYRRVPIAYIWDDHDFGGNESDGRSPSHEAARHTYEEFVPHYPLPFEGEGPISQSFSVGRVKFILTDLRSQRSSVTNEDGAGKSMLGAAQKAWFKRELLEARDRFPLICWVSSVPWIGRDGTNVYRRVGTNHFGYFHHTNLPAAPRPNEDPRRGPRPPGRRPSSEQDHWSVFATERREIADFIKSNHIQGVCILHGDSHMLAADDGTFSDYATGGGAPIPVMCGGPLDQDPSLKGGPYSQGVYRVRKGESGFGLLQILDRGDHIDVHYSGRNNRNEEKITLSFVVPAPSAKGPPP